MSRRIIIEDISRTSLDDALASHHIHCGGGERVVNRDGTLRLEDKDGMGRVIGVVTEMPGSFGGLRVDMYNGWGPKAVANFVSLLVLAP